MQLKNAGHTAAIGDQTERTKRRSHALEWRRELMDVWADYCEPRGDKRYCNEELKESRSVEFQGSDCPAQHPIPQPGISTRYRYVRPKGADDGVILWRIEGS